MRLFCWPKILLDTKVNTNSACLKPNSASFGLWKGLRHFRNTKQSRVEAPCRVFTAGRHGELNVMDSADRAFGHRRIVADRIQLGHGCNPPVNVCELAKAGILGSNLEKRRLVMS